MFKKIALILLALVFALAPLASCAAGGDVSNVEEPDTPMGDADGNGVVNEADLLLLRSYLAIEAAEIHYEFCDLDGNFKVNDSDAEILESYLNGETDELSGTAFAREDEDITNKLEDLGINNYERWDDSNIKYIMSRNPYDMMASNGVVMVSGGNYQDNTGPVVINGYSIYEDGPVAMGTLATEQVNRFYDCGDYVVALAIDAKLWQYGDVYLKPAASNKWITQSRVLIDNIHCYDMICYNGSYFFCGSNVGYKLLNGINTELSKVSVYKVDGELSDSMTQKDFQEVKVVNKHGKVITFESVLSSWIDSNGDKQYYKMGVPRFYEFFEFQGKLYAFYYNQYSDRYDEESNFNGLYVYDEEANRFIYDEALDIEGLIPVFSGTAQDGEKIQHDFAWGDRYYFINAGLYSTADFISYKEEKIAGYEDHLVRDVIFRGGKAYLLASCELEDGTFTNVVLETFDFESFRPLLHFDSELFARSFEFCNGEFYFGLGYSYSEYYEHKDGSECGRIYRYTYYR